MESKTLSNFDGFNDVNKNVNNESKSLETFKNFDDFNNMFKGIDRHNRTPDSIAWKILEKVRLEHNPSRLDDAVKWFDESHFFKIRYTMNNSTSTRLPTVSNIED